MSKKSRPIAPTPVKLVFERADPEALARFDPSTKLCVMNCGPHTDDPRTAKERKFLCNDCQRNTP